MSRAFQLIQDAEGRYSLRGGLTFATASEALNETGGLFARRTGLVLDLGGVDRADSAGVALMIEWLRRAKASGVELRYARLPKSLQAIIRVSGVEELIPVEGAGTEYETNEQSTATR
jgi:phospholipid transport system transporter-binding protein